MRLLLSLLLVQVLSLAANAPGAEQALAIGSRLELFVDDFLIANTTGDVKHYLHKPTPREVVLVTDKPWEGNTCAYYTIFRDGEKFRMYYRGSHYDTKKRKAGHREVTCYAESTDGIHWTKPELGLFQFGGSKKNNIVLDGIGTHCFVAFKDQNPNCTPEARYKGIARGQPRGKKGLYVFKSPDGIRWSLIKTKPVITSGAFDSQNLAFWDEHAKVYREYHRTFHRGKRAIMTGTSSDYVKWSQPELLKYPGAPHEHLYTNAVRTYFRAPHILLGFPTRYLPRKQQVEPTFMASRDGRTFRRWTEAVIPQTAPKDRDGNRSNYMAWGLVSLPGNKKELSVYATEAYYTGPDSRLRRFTYRTDGFVSMRAGSKGGDLLTKPLKFKGGELRVNFVTKKGGSILVELQDHSGKPIPGYTQSDSKPLTGDAIERVVRWKEGSDLSKLASKPVRVRFVMKDADLYSMRFLQEADAQSTAADDQFPPELVDFVPYKKNPVFVAQGKGHWDTRIRERGWILREGDTYHMWYTGYVPGGQMMLGYATSADGLVWTRYKKNPIYRDHWVEDMMVVKQGDTYYMFAEGRDDQAHLLTSKDKVNWKRHGPLDVRLTSGKPIPPGAYGTPTGWFENDKWYLLYERRDLGVWLATSKDLKVWTNVQDEPVFRPGPDAYDKDMIALNQVVKHKGRYYAYYHGLGRAHGKWTTNVITSTDLIHWKKYAKNPLFPVVENKSSGILVHDGKQYRLYTMHDQVRVHFPRGK